MDRRLLLALAAIPLVLVAAAPTHQPISAHEASIQGKWETTDVFDGSRMTMWIRADKDIESIFDISYFDQSCGGCNGLPGRGRFVAFTIDENLIHGVGFFRSQGQAYFFQLEGDWLYEPSTDTVLEWVAGFEQTWHRATGN